MVQCTIIMVNDRESYVGNYYSYFTGTCKVKISSIQETILHMSRCNMFNNQNTNLEDTGQVTFNEVQETYTAMYNWSPCMLYLDPDMIKARFRFYPFI